MTLRWSSTILAAVTSALLAPGCSGGGAGGSLDATPPDATAPPSAGEDLDERTTRELRADYALPAEFYAALDTLGIAPRDLFFPDAGATFSAIPTRLHWTDTLRHQGDLAPVFAHMVAEDVEAAVAAGPEESARELLVAQYTYNDRDAFVTSRYDRKITADSDTALLDALRAFYQHAPVQGDLDVPSAAWADIEADVRAQVATLPAGAQDALALALPALVKAAEMRDAAFLDSGLVDVDTWTLMARSFWEGTGGFSTYSHDYGTNLHPAVDWELLARAGMLAVRAIESLRLDLASVPLQPGAGLDLDAPLGRVTVRWEDAADEWRTDGAGWFLLVDGGGNDTYYENVAANTSFWLPVSVVLDLQGDDDYRVSSSWTIDDLTIPIAEARSQGAGLFGIAILDDAAGDDHYFGSALVQGTGVFGVGVLLDHAGNDVYQGYRSSQGHAEFGYGLLADFGDGNDRYETLDTSQGYGGPRGIGWLVDEGGDDTYLAIKDPLVVDWAGEGSNWSGSQGFGFGVRDGFFTPGAPIFSGGLGGLFDLSGNDEYQCAVMCQGFGYAFGTGIFYDAGGDDTHLTTHKYAMGAATHWAVGVYLDMDGADTYTNDDDDECIGEGYDGSVAFHLDRGQGNDVYTLDNFGDFTLGVALHPSLGVLINEGGDDTYSVPGAGLLAIGRACTNAGDRAGYMAGVPTVGMFFDLGGTDTYGIARAGPADGSEWIQDDAACDGWAAGLDLGYGLDK
jgi:hypothetical protein